MTNGQTTEQPTLPNQAGGSGVGFWGRNKKMIIRLIIVAVIIGIAAVYAKTQPVDNNAEEKTKAEEQAATQPETGLVVEQKQDGVSGVSVSEDKGESPEVVVKPLQETAETIRVTDDKITVVVMKGNGYTQLARRALAEYLKTHNVPELRAEHKIFIEDFLQKKVPDKHRLFAGDEVSFSTTQIQEAIDAALQLTDSQIQNLSKYVPLVPSLN